jgi:Zn-dependent peptidase ImmA (M78 family)
VDEFRGFALSDPLAPIIFVNDSDAKAAQVFTIAHELAHIWIAADGVSDRKPNQKGESKNAIELFCDQVAAEGLVPSTEFSSTWVGKSVMENAKNAAAHFRVSTLVALRRARDLGYISFDSFMVHVDAEYTRFREIEKKKKAPSKKKDGGGGNFWASFEIRNSRAFNAAVVTAIRSNRTTFTEASNLLGVTLAATVRYLKRVSAN